MKDQILSALHSMDVRDLSYEEWLSVGMALKHEGFDWTVWDEWSSTDPEKYHSGECRRKWEGFHGSGTPVTGGSIIHMASTRGWKPYTSNSVLDWNDAISYDGSDLPTLPQPEDMSPAQQLSRYIRTLFHPDEVVGYVTGDVWQAQDGEWNPGRGVYDRTA